jgi:hypothetical protein
MKTKIFILKEHEHEMFRHVFEPVRDKIAVLKILLNSVDYILHSFDNESCDIQDNDINTNNNIKFILSINKHSRILFCSSEKIFSIIFPFHYDEKQAALYFYDLKIHQGITSYAREMLKFLENNGSELFSNKLIDFYVENFYEVRNCDANSTHINDAVTILNNLFLFEDGYIRYDNDPEHENGNLHPLHHYDVFYDDKNTFKIGLSSEIGYKEFIELLDCSKERSFLYKK